jgi:hypothetical protein
MRCIVFPKRATSLSCPPEIAAICNDPEGEDEFGFEGRLVAVPEVYLGYKDAIAREP